MRIEVAVEANTNPVAKWHGTIVSPQKKFRDALPLARRMSKYAGNIIGRGAFRYRRTVTIPTRA